MKRKIKLKKGDKLTLISLYPDLRNPALRSISSYLKERGIKTQIIFIVQEFYEKYNDKDLENLVKLCKDSDIVGITLMSLFFKKAVIVTKKIKEKLDCKVVWGGVHPFVSPKECLKYADEICIGDGETFFTGKNKQLENIDIIPDLDFSTQYMLKNGKIIQLNEKLFNESCRGIYYTFITRGCPFDCSFCTNHKLKEIYPVVRKRKIENIIQELLYVKEKLPSFKKIDFSDDNICILSTEYLKFFFKQYKEKINLPFYTGGLHPLLISEKKIKILKDAGLILGRMGIQTGNDNTRKIFNRLEKDEHVIKASKIFKKYKIKAEYDFITDNPYETKRDVIQTLKLINKLERPFTIHLHSLLFFKGTKLYEIAKKDNFYREVKKSNVAVKNNYFNSLYLFLNHHKVSEKTLDFLLNIRFPFLKHIFFTEHKLLLISKYFPNGIKRLLKLDFNVLKRIFYIWKENYTR